VNPQSFRYEESQAVATLTLDRPARLNALTFEVYRELIETFRALQARQHVRAVVLTGAGESFCSGGDVQDIIGELLKRDADGLLQFTRMTCELVRRCARCTSRSWRRSTDRRPAPARRSRWRPTCASRPSRRASRSCS
jgi:enoyl-CoA hydratase/carnithine racemase